MTRRIGVCSWSLRAGGPEELVQRVRATGAAAVQLALDPLRTGEWDEERTLALLREAGVAVLSGMVATAGEDYSSLESIRATGGLRPDATWAANREAAAANARLARRAGLSLVTFHAGFLPEDRGDPEREKLLARLREFVDRFADEGVACAFETGQEHAPVLAAFLDELDRPEAGINFDPANMVLYGMGDPIEALRLLAPRVRQIHVKDARPTEVPGTWGTEVPAGTGAVDWSAFFDVLADRDVGVDLVVEREAGEDRIGDVRSALELIESQRVRLGEV